MPKKKQRKPVSVTFVFETDYTDKKNKSVCEHARYRVMNAIVSIMDFVGLEEYDLIAFDKKDYYERLKEKNIPELWIHEAGNDKISPFADYYFVEFDDDSKKVYALIPPSYEEEQGDPAYR